MIPKDLRRVDVDIPEEQKTCATCGVKRALIGEDVSGKYDCIPAEVTCRCTRRLKYSGCACRPGVISAPAPVQAVEKGLAADGLLAHVITSKYVDHQPLYRMEGILARHGAEISRRTLFDWVAESADALYRSGRIVEVGCRAQVRRKFFDTRQQDPEALKVLSLIQKLYEVERQAAAPSHEERAARRRERSTPLLEQIDRVRAAVSRTALPKSGLGEALRYLHNQRNCLGRHLLDGRLNPDNNGAENHLRVVAVGRKNWLFAGSTEGARRAALLYTLTQGCKLAGVEPFR